MTTTQPTEQEESTVCECGKTIRYPPPSLCEDCIGEFLHENRMNKVLQSKIFNTTSIYPKRSLWSPCNDCAHTSWLTDSSGCTCLCHQKTISEDPILPPTSPQWIEFKELYRIKSKSEPRKTSEEKAAHRKAYLENNKERKRAYSKERYERNRDRELAANKEYYEAHKDEIKAWHKEYYAKNKDRILARNKKWRETSVWHKEHYEKNKDKISAQHKVYYRKNRDRFRAYFKRYRASKRISK